MIERTEASAPFPIDRTELTIGTRNDQYGHTNYKSYPGLFEAGQDAYMAARGQSFDEIESTHDLRSVVPSYKIAIRDDSHQGERATVETSISKVGKSSFTFGQSMLRGEILIADYSMTVVLIDESGTPRPIPQSIREKLQARPSAEE